MERSTSTTKPSLEDSTYNVITQLEKKADFLYSAADQYVNDAVKDNKPELVKLWNSIRDDERKHLEMLRQQLVKEVKQDNFK